MAPPTRSSAWMSRVWGGGATHSIQQTDCKGMGLAAEQAHDQQLLHHKVGVHHQRCSGAGIALSDLRKPDFSASAGGLRTDLH